MSTLAVTFGDGLLQPIAEGSARRFAELNGIEALAIDPLDAPPLEDPTWVKAFLWDLVPKSVDRIIWFDCDCIPIAPVMDLFPRSDYPFGAVPDIPESTAEAMRHYPEAKKCKYYFNAGFFFARRVTQPLFEDWKGMIDENAGFRDQTSLNILLNKYYGSEDVYFLPPLVNWMGALGMAPPEVRMLHLAGWPNTKQKMQIMLAFSRIFLPVVKGVSPREEMSCAAS